MPRDGSGNYSLPVGNPVVTNTVISSTWANTTMSDIAAQLNNVFTRDGLLGPTGPFKIVDGTVAQPGLAWNSEPGLGWYRGGAGIISTASAGKVSSRLDASSAAGVVYQIFPRASGVGSINIYNNASGTANMNQISLGLNAGSSWIIIDRLGTAGALPLYFQKASTYNFDNTVYAPGTSDGFVTTGYWGDSNTYGTSVLRSDPNWGTLRLQTIHVPGQWAGWRFYADSTQMTVDIKMSGSSVTMDLGGPTPRTNAIADSALALRSGANPTSNRMVFTWADPGGQTDYLWGGQDGTNMRLTHRNNLTVGRADRVNSVEGAGGGTLTSGINISGGPTWTTISYDVTAGGNFKSLKSSSHWWRWHWNDPDSNLYAFVDDNNVGWVTRNSDERLKEDIEPLVSDTDAFMRLAPINFRWKKIGAITNNDFKIDGLSAQNVKANFPMAAFGDFDTPPKEDGTMDFPGAVDDRAVLAHTILQVQKLITKVAALESK